MKNNQNLTNLIDVEYLPPSLKPFLQELCSEEAAYAADELVALGEELLEFLSALSIMVYLHSESQTPALNQYILELFQGARVGNAGVIFHYASRMLFKVNNNLPLRNQIFESLESVYPEVKPQLLELSAMRNRLMHGIFIAPPETNTENTDRICDLMSELFSDGSCRFELKDQNSLHWNGIAMNLLFDVSGSGEITIADSWSIFRNPEKISQASNELATTGDFLELHQQAEAELSGEFLKTDRDYADELIDDKYIKECVPIIEKLRNKKGAIHVVGGLGVGKTAFWATAIGEIEKAGYHVIAYRIRSLGLSFTDDVLLRSLADLIHRETGVAKNKNLLKYVAKNALHEKVRGKIVVIIDDIHLRQFSSSHILRIVNELYDAKIRLVAFAPGYPSLLPYFNERLKINRPPREPEQEDFVNLLNEFIRDKGPYPEDSEKKNASYERLQKTIENLWNRVQEPGALINLRNLAGNGNDYSLSLLEEAAAILSPICKHGQEKFQEDKIHPILEHPEVPTEMSFPYAVLKRRDIRMEWEAPTICKA